MYDGVHRPAPREILQMDADLSSDILEIPDAGSYPKTVS